MPLPRAVARHRAGSNSFPLLFAYPASPPWYQASRDTPPPGMGTPMTAALNAPPDESRHSDRETRLIIEHMPGFAWSAGQDGKLRYVNPRFLEFTGQRIEDVARTEVLHPEDVERTVTAWSHAVATGEPYLVEHRVRRFDGTYRWFRVAAARGRDSSSQELRWYGVDLDVDDQKRTDDALRESEHPLPQL